MAKLERSNLIRKPENAKALADKIKNKTAFTRFKKPEKPVHLEYASDEAEYAFKQINGFKYKDIPEGKIFRNAKDKKELLRLSDIKKTMELGSSKGSGGGADATAATESLCCYFAAYLFNGGADKFILEKDYTEELNTFFSKPDKAKLVQAQDKTTKLTYEKCWDFWNSDAGLKKDAEWMDTFKATANIIKTNATKFTSPVYFHRGSPFMASIYEKKKTCEKHNRDMIKSGTSMSYIYESVATFSDDKWNPGDIWMSTQKPTEEPFTWTMPDMPKNMEKHICDWPSLQKAVFQSALWGETLGISLKKTGASATLKEFNNIGDVKERIKYKGFRFGDGDFFNSVDMYIEFNNGSIQYRPTDGDSSWQGEIKGTKASGGKAGGGPTNYFAELYFGRSIDADSKLLSGTWKEKKGKISTEDKGKMYNLYLKYNTNQTVKKKTSVKIKKEVAVKTGNPYASLSSTNWILPSDNGSADKGSKDLIWTSKKDVLNLKDFIILGDAYTSRGKNASKSFYFGKYMALAFVDILQSKGNPSPNQSGFATEVVRYAMSNIDNVSTYFWKIS